jgi:hypothetical protein
LADAIGRSGEEEVVDTSRRAQPLIMTNYFRIRDGKVVTGVIPVTLCHE